MSPPFSTIYWASCGLLVFIYGLQLAFTEEEWGPDELCNFVFVALAPGLNTFCILWMIYEKAKQLWHKYNS